MLPKLEVKVAQDTLKEFTKAKPVHALEQLIWNAFDADADEVQVRILSSELTGVESIVVQDNGHGLPTGHLARAFEYLGGSPKRARQRTESGRIAHGRSGRGRYRALALGADVVWEFRQRDIENAPVDAYVVRITAEKLSRPELQEVDASSPEPGCTVTVSSCNKSANELLTANLLTDLGGIFASHLLTNTGTTILVNGKEIDPKVDLVDEVHAVISNRPVDASVHILFWRDSKRGQEIYLCRADGIALVKDQRAPKVGGISYTAYVSSAAFQEDWNEEFATISESAESVATRRAAQETIRDILRKRLSKEAEGTVEMLKKEGSYPYRGEPEGRVEVAEREVFSIAATQLYELKPKLLETTQEDRKVKMQVLAAAVGAEPSSRDRIIQKVFGLSDTDADSFARVLERVELSSVVAMVNRIHDRIQFMEALRAIVYNRDHRKRLRERTQLHKILLDDVWIFGEQFAVAASDVGLRTILKDHIKKLGREDLAPEPAVDESDLSMDRIPDLLLERMTLNHEGIREHLVVELKRPSVKVGMSEYMQINDYATTIASHPSFDMQKTKWKFVVVSSEIDERPLSGVLNQRNRHPALASDSEDFSIWVYTWAQLIQEAEGRMKFLKDALDVDVSEGDTEEFLRRTRPQEVLPDSFAPQSTAS